MKDMTLGRRHVSRDSRPYVIAEIGVNHEGSMDIARRLIDLCKEGGADAAKFQTYKADRIASRHSPAYWDTAKEPTTSQHKLFQKYDMFGPDEYVALADHCRDVEIDFLSTPFDSNAVEFLDPLVPFHKIASADLTNVPLLRQVASKGKPVVLSTGASTLGEIDTAVFTLKKAGCRDFALLHCVLNYPCPNENAHLNMIRGLRRAYPDVLVGYSDHTLPDDRMLILSAAWLKGAVVLEKHFTHDKSLPGNDHYHAMDVEDLKKFIHNIDLLCTVNGFSTKMPLPDEAPARQHARRSIVLERALKTGETIHEIDITYKRPAHGISPVHWDEVIGRKVRIDLEEDHILQWEELV
ncbi:MAG: N-acetylneuraminate synthase family protein [Alphaproteobacteria bacterium]|nr:N-acetylneuraminate synthase family protein [Alphaproteobacteria bacterium]